MSKKMITGISLLLCMAAVMVSCGVQPFKSIQIKASPSFAADLGSKDLLLHTYMDKNKLEEEYRKAISADTGSVTMYDYIDTLHPDKQVYLLHYRQKSFNLDVDPSLKTDLDSTKAEIDEQTFSVPAVKKEETQQIDLSSLETQLNTLVKAPFKATESSPLPVPPVSPPDSTRTVPLNFGDIQTVEFEAEGSSGPELQVTIEGGSCTIESAKLTYTGDEILNSSVNKTEMKFNLSGKTLPQNITLEFKLATSSNTAGATIKSKLTGTVKRATGVTLNNPITPTQISQTIPVGGNSNFKEAVIGEGSFKLTPELPSGWENITFEKKVGLTQTSTGGLNIAQPSSFEDMSTPISLNGKAINKESITVTADVQVQVKNATYVKQDSSNVNITAVFSVTKFSEVTLAMQKANLTKTATKQISNTLKTISNGVEAQSVVFEKELAAVTLKHNFPEGNEIGLKLTAADFNITDQEKKFPRSDVGHTETYASSAETSIDLTSTQNMSFTATLVLPDQTDSGSNDVTFKLKNIEPGKTYSLGGAVEFKPKWKSMKVKITKNKSGTFPAFKNIKTLSKKLEKYHLSVLEMPIYCYFSAPVLENKGVTAKIKVAAKVTKNGTPTPYALFAADAAGNPPADMPINPAPLRLSAGADKTVYTIPQKAVLTIEKGKPNVQKTLAEIINTKPDSIELSYEVKLDNTLIDLTKEEIDKIKAKDQDANMQFDMLIQIPAGFTAGTGGTVIDLQEEMHKKGQDLFSRSGASDINKFMDYLKAVKLILHTANDTGLTPILSVTSPGVIDAKTVQLKAGNNDIPIAFTSDEIKNIAKTVPFSPEMKVTLPAGEYRMKRGAGFSIGFEIAADTDINYEIKR